MLLSITFVLNFYLFLLNSWLDFLFLNDFLLYYFLLFSLYFSLFLFFLAFLMIALLLLWGLFVVVWTRLRFFFIFILIISNNKVFLFRCSLIIIDLVRENTFNFFNNPPELNPIIWILFKHQLRLVILFLSLLLLFFPLKFLSFSFLTSFSFFFFTSLNFFLSLFLFLFTSFLLFRIDL